MTMQFAPGNRRQFMKGCGLSLLGSATFNAVRPARAACIASDPLPIAALITAYYPVSHADVIVSKILEGYLRNGDKPRSSLKLVSMFVEQDHPHDLSRSYLLEHKDGLKSAVIMTAGYSGGFAFACKIKGQREPVACWFKRQDHGVFGHFSYLLDAFEATIRQGQAVYPLERTLLTTGVLNRCMQQVAAGGGRVSTPELEFSYQAGEWPFANHPETHLTLPHD